MNSENNAPIPFPGDRPDAAAVGCSLCSYFSVEAGQLEAARALCRSLVVATAEEPKCLYYSVGFCGHLGYVRGDYADSLGLMSHIDNVGRFAGEISGIADSFRLEVHGSEAELEALREPSAAFKPRFFALESGFRK